MVQYLQCNGFKEFAKEIFKIKKITYSVSFLFHKTIYILQSFTTLHVYFSFSSTYTQNLQMELQLYDAILNEIRRQTFNTVLKVRGD